MFPWTTPIMFDPLFQVGAALGVPFGMAIAFAGRRFFLWVLA